MVLGRGFKSQLNLKKTRWKSLSLDGRKLTKIISFPANHSALYQDNIEEVLSAIGQL